jgi:hypothetical protein
MRAGTGGHLQQAVQTLRAQGYPVDNDDLARISPLWFKNILVHGTYDFSDLALPS